MHPSLYIKLRFPIGGYLWIPTETRDQDLNLVVNMNIIDLCPKLSNLVMSIKHRYNILVYYWNRGFLAAKIMHMLPIDIYQLNALNCICILGLSPKSQNKPWGDNMATIPIHLFVPQHLYLHFFWGGVWIFLSNWIILISQSLLWASSQNIKIKLTI